MPPYYFCCWLSSNTNSHKYVLHLLVIFFFFFWDTKSHTCEIHLLLIIFQYKQPHICITSASDSLFWYKEPHIAGDSFVIQPHIHIPSSGDSSVVQTAMYTYHMFWKKILVLLQVHILYQLLSRPSTFNTLWQNQWISLIVCMEYMFTIMPAPGWKLKVLDFVLRERESVSYTHLTLPTRRTV